MASSSFHPARAKSVLPDRSDEVKSIEHQGRSRTNFAQPALVKPPIPALPSSVSVQHALDSSVAPHIQSTRRKIITLLKTNGRLTAEQLAAALGITTSGVRQHLTALERDGLVAHQSVQAGLGRPTYHYHLTSLAEDLFPKRYPALANELLQFVEHDGGAAAVDSLFARRAERRVNDARKRLAGLDLKERVAEVTRILDEDGYLAEWTELGADTYRIVENNCAIVGVASLYSQACSSELDFLSRALDAEVEREAHLLRGKHVCSYIIRPHTSERKSGREGAARGHRVEP